MAKLYAIVESGQVTNVVIWDGVSKWDGSNGAMLVPAGISVGIGWAYDGTDFVAPLVPPIPLIVM